MTTAEHQALEGYVSDLKAGWSGKKAVLVLMRAANLPPLHELFRVIAVQASALGLEAVRPEQRLVAPDLWRNSEAYMRAADAAIAVFDDLPEPWRHLPSHSPRLAVEVGYMLGQGKPVMLLRDRSLAVQPSELKASYRRWRGIEPDSAADEVRAWLEAKLGPTG